ncbi:hypothetical protein GRI43_12480 [Altererythrobacter luteolus]|uniref:Uncharacterized protein n=1 Tax=Pontixanthobacter luteolus TaxID=295089 RepID=A0A6I4V2Q0_9SPHN|nr:hypothetical protein [Pontixanthobacter luteolus]MXP48203.1 hypothetical protein [Pontixanthobacter luteolus]
MAKADRTKGGSIELLIEIDSFEQSYHIADHRAEIGRVDDEAIIEIRGKIVRTSDHRPLVGAPAEMSLVCSQSYHAAPDTSEAPMPMLMTASHSQGAFKALGYLPPQPFWSLPDMISSGRVSHVIVDYRAGVGRGFELHALYFTSHENIKRQELVHSP